MLTVSNHRAVYGWRDSATIWLIWHCLERLRPTGACVTNLYQNLARLFGATPCGRGWAISRSNGNKGLLTTGT
jgi:hypothetical protein